MGTGQLHAKVLFPAIGSVVLACVLACPASAGDNVQIVPFYSDNGGNGAWVEIDSTGERMKATPFVAVGRKELGKVLENPEEKGRLALPVPRLMRLVERARQAIRDMQRPDANAPAGPGDVTAVAAEPAGQAREPQEIPPDRTGLSAPPGTTDRGILPSDLLYSAAAR